MPIAVTTTAADLAEGIAGPEGKVGRVVAMYAAITTVYVGTDTISLDAVTTSLTTPPTLAITGADDIVVHATAAALQGFSDLTADTPMVLASTSATCDQKKLSGHLKRAIAKAKKDGIGKQGRITKKS